MNVIEDNAQQGRKTEARVAAQAIDAREIYPRTELDFKAGKAGRAYRLNGRDWTPRGGIQGCPRLANRHIRGPQFAIFCYNPNPGAGHVDAGAFEFTDKRNPARKFPSLSKNVNPTPAIGAPSVHPARQSWRAQNANASARVEHDDRPAVLHFPGRPGRGTGHDALPAADTRAVACESAGPAGTAPGPRNPPPPPLLRKDSPRSRYPCTLTVILHCP